MSLQISLEVARVLNIQTADSFTVRSSEDAGAGADHE